MRKIFHNGTNGVSFGMDVDGRSVRLAFAFCNPQDQFRRKTANVILNNRLDHPWPSNNVVDFEAQEPMEVFKFFIGAIYSGISEEEGKVRSRRRVDRIKTILSNFVEKMTLAPA